MAKANFESAKLLNSSTESITEMYRMAGWQEIDGWEDKTHEVSIWWMDKDGEDAFLLGLEPKSSLTPRAVDMTFEEIQAVRHEHHTYPFVAPKVGHLAAVQAIGIPEAA